MGIARALWLLLFVSCTSGKHPRGPTRPVAPAKPVVTDAHPDATMKIHLIDVGAGASTLIEFSCAAILIDTGGEQDDAFDSTANVKAYLDQFFESRPDLDHTLALLITTHNHIDHLRGADAVFSNYKVENVVTNGMVDSSGGEQQAALMEAAIAAKVPLRKIKAKSIPAGGLTDNVIDPVKCEDGDPDIRVLWGAADDGDVDWNGKAMSNANNHSVATRIALGKSSILITGDLEEDGIEALLSKHKGTHVLDSDVYQVGHHGSYNATTEDLLDAITPKLALIAVGSTDRQFMWTSWAYGHPRLSTIELLEDALKKSKAAPRPKVTKPVGTHAKEFEDRTITEPIYASGWDGIVDVTLWGDGHAPVVKTAK